VPRAERTRPIVDVRREVALLGWKAERREHGLHAFRKALEAFARETDPDDARRF